MRGLERHGITILSVSLIIHGCCMQWGVVYFSSRWCNHGSLTKHIVSYCKTSLPEGQTDLCWSVTTHSDKDHLKLRFSLRHEAHLSGAIETNLNNICAERCKKTLQPPGKMMQVYFDVCKDCFWNCASKGFILKPTSCAGYVNWSKDSNIDSPVNVDM